MATQKIWAADGWIVDRMKFRVSLDRIYEACKGAIKVNVYVIVKPPSGEAMVLLCWTAGLHRTLYLDGQVV